MDVDECVSCPLPSYTNFSAGCKNSSCWNTQGWVLTFSAAAIFKICNNSNRSFCCWALESTCQWWFYKPKCASAKLTNMMCYRSFKCTCNAGYIFVNASDNSCENGAFKYSSSCKVVKTHHVIFSYIVLIELWTHSSYKKCMITYNKCSNWLTWDQHGLMKICCCSH